ncbi:BLUF domain-containing protein [Sulfitobacter sp. HNIBRBA3233]|uniref:BLUF domain-containing protein n=1 Tax=Sulfitobacter marinivivus TaxID=3158558 RepID=UPI0032DE3C36
MIRLMYFSTAASYVSKAELDALCDSSASKNASRSLTGMLAFNGRNFCQIIEGEENDVDDLIEVIRADSRHAGFKVLARKPISERYFDGWSLRRVDSLDFSEAFGAMDA